MKAMVVVSCVAAALAGAQVYTDVTGAMGINIPGLGSGAAFADLDGDDDLDLLASTSSSGSLIYVYRNDGSTFTNVTAASGITGEARNFAVGDYDNDGRPDVATISFGYLATRLFHNVGGLKFEDVSATAGIFGTYGWRCAWVDYDRDGDLDFFQCGTTNYLFRNLGNGTFQEGAAAAGIAAGGKSCAWFDYDRDGEPDCYIGRSNAGNFLYHNLGGGTFEEVGAQAGVADPYGTSGVCAGDFNGDGWFDLYSVNISSPSNKLFKNLGNGTFQDITASSGTGDVGDGRTATFLDLDYDGRVDLFSSNHVNANRLYHNNGDETFTDIAAALNIQNPPDPFGTAFGDFDGDGDGDVFLATHFGNKLLRCDGVDGHWLVARFVGTTSNRGAVGAVARAEFGGGLCAYGYVDGGHGMGDMDSPELEFGLGTATDLATLTAWWPSGRVEAWYNLGRDKYVTLTEGTGETPVGLTNFTASPSSRGVVLRWETEGAPAGFNVYREEKGAGERAVKLNPEPVTGRSPVRYLDATATPGGVYRYWLEALEPSGARERYGPATCKYALETVFALGQNYPNPARGETTIPFSLPAAGDVAFTLYDLAGREVAMPLAGNVRAGANRLTVDCSGLPPGIYMYKLEAGDNVAVRRLAVVR